MAIADTITVIQRATKPMSMGLARSLDGFGQTAIQRAMAIGSLDAIPGDASRQRAADALASVENWITGDDADELVEPHAQDLRNAVSQCLTEYDGVTVYVNGELDNAIKLYSDTVAAIKEFPTTVGTAAQQVASASKNFLEKALEDLGIGLGVAIGVAVGGFLLYEWATHDG